MKARSSATVHPNGVLAELECQPPLTLRQVTAPSGTCGLCLVGTAAGPLPGDDLELSLDVAAGARAHLTAAAASIAQGRGSVAAHLRMVARVGFGASLAADTGALIVAQGAQVDVVVELQLAATASVAWRELVILGRTTDRCPGALTVRWDVEREGEPVLRQLLDLADPQLAGQTVTGGNRVLATEFRSSPDLAARTMVHAPTAVTQRIDGHTTVTTVLGNSAAEVTDTLHALTSAATAAPTRG